MTDPILPTRNEGWGFFGTIDRIGNDLAADADKAWTLAFEAVRAATGGGDEGVRFFLDSRYGRHFADDVASEFCRGDTLKEAIDAATARWMGWTIRRRKSRETGIPAGLPYLTGFVLNAGIETEIEA